MIQLLHAFQVPGEYVSDVAIHQDRLVFSNTSTDLHVYSLAGEPLQRVPSNHVRGVSSVTFSPSGKLIGSGADDYTVQLYSCAESRTVHKLVGHTAPVTKVKFSHKGNIVVSASVDESIRIWDAIAGTCLKILSAHSEPVADLDLSFDSSMIASGSYDGLIRIFDTTTGQCLKTLVKEGVSFPICGVKFSPNSKYLLVSSLDGVVRLWDFLNNKVVRTFRESSMFEKYSCGLEFVVKDCVYVVSGSECGDVYVWDLQSRQLQQTLHGHAAPVVSLVKSETHLVSLSLDGKCCVWGL